MRITSHTGIYAAVRAANQAKPKKTKEVESVKENKIEHIPNTDNEKTIDYSYLKPKKQMVDKAEVERMQRVQEFRMREGFMQMAKEIVLDQSTGYKQALGQLLSSNKIGADEIAQAKIDIADGGYWSVSKTANRILSFAKSLSSSNPELAAELKEGFIKGFEAAEKAWGGKLPEICYETKEAVLNEFNSWEKENSGQLDSGQ